MAKRDKYGTNYKGRFKIYLLESKILLEHLVAIPQKVGKH